jgi:predicted component of type VI protein secretion system
MPRLVLSLDGVVLREVALTKDRTTIGRRSHNDIVIDNLAVSGEHAVIYSSGGEVYLEDLGSTNGTTVNGQPIKKHLLQSGDAVEIGKYRLKFLADGATGTEGEVDIDTSQPLKREFYGPGPATIQIRQPGTGEDSPAAASIKILNGANEGRELQLVKALTTIGRPATRSRSSRRRPTGYFIAHVEAKSSPPSTAPTSVRRASAEEQGRDRTRRRADGFRQRAVRPGRSCLIRSDETSQFGTTCQNVTAKRRIVRSA